MARGQKKADALTSEEKLEQAMVPEGEQPYEVPENWCWVKLGCLGYTNIGLTYKPSDKSTEGVIVLRSSNIQEGCMDYSDIVRVNTNIPESKMSRKGDILICARNGSKSLVGKTAIIDADGMSYGAFMAIFRSPYNNLIFHYLNTSYFRDTIDSEVGTTTINQLTQATIKELPFPLPPLAEQQRIVDRIEILFAKLDEAREKVQEIVDGFDTRKAAILHKAFSGELTVQWRKEHNCNDDSINNMNLYKSDLVSSEDFPCAIPDTWIWVRMGALGYTTIGLTYKPSDKAEDGTIVLRSSNIQNSKIDYNDIVKVNVKIPENKMCQIGDILICARNGSKSLVGKSAIVDAEGMSFGAFMAIFRSEYNPFIYYFLNSPFFRDIIDQDVGTTTINQVTQTLLKDLPFPFAPIEEQKEIISILDTLLPKEQQAKEAAETVLELIDLIKKSILARAFRGELGTNNPSEESAVELLRGVLQ